jgi:hypothetical protein
VQAIGKTGQRRVFVGGFRIEKVAGVEADLADARASALELRIGGEP